MASDIENATISGRALSWSGGLILTQICLVHLDRFVQTKDEIADNIVIVRNLNVLYSVQGCCLVVLDGLCARHKQASLEFHCQRVHRGQQILGGDAVRMAWSPAHEWHQFSERTDSDKGFYVRPPPIAHALPLIPEGVPRLLERIPRSGKRIDLAFDFLLARLALAPAIIVYLLSNDASRDPSGKQRATTANQPSGKGSGELPSRSRATLEIASSQCRRNSAQS
jgi:hypothetical protein